MAQQPVRVGEEFRINSYTTSTQFVPSVGMDSDGNFVVTWASLGQDGSNLGIYAQRYINNGIPIGEEFQVNTYTTNKQEYPSIGMDSDGNFVIAWTSREQDGSGYGIYAQRYSSNGIPQGSEFQVNSYTTNRQYSPSVGIDDDGNFIITWTSLGQDGSGYGVYAQRYVNDGTPQGEEFQVNSYTTNRQFESKVAMDSDGDFVVIWVSNAQDGDSYGIYGQRYAKNGNPQESEFQVNTYTTLSQRQAYVEMDSEGNFIVAWTSSGQDSNTLGVYAQRYTSGGNPIGNEFQVNTYTTSSQVSPSIEMNSEGDFVIAWGSLYQDGDAGGLYAQCYISDGTPKGQEFQVNTYTTSSQGTSSMAGDGKGNFIITWSSVYQDGDRGGIYAQRYKIPTPTIPDISTLVLNTCTRPYSAAFDPITEAIGYQVQITVLARNGEIITRRIDDNEISGNFNIPRRLLGTDVEIQIAAIFLDDETGEEVIGEFSKTGTFTLGCDAAGNLVLESRNTNLYAIQLSPNPVQNQLQVQLQSNVASAAELKILSLDGKILLEQQQSLFEGQNDLNINVEPLAVGTYFLQILTETGVEQVKFVKL
ncbi:MAG: T9SS type A sorting domain-containing protein [Bacteroidota bacterium]